MSKISVFKAPIRNTTPYRDVSLSDIATVIRSDKYKPTTEKLRALANKDERDLCKANDLDYTTFSGTFGHRANKALIEHSGYFGIDIDHIGNTDAIANFKLQIRSIYEPAMMFVSPSGDGLKIVFKINVNEASHEQYFIAFQNFFRFELNIEIDEKCKDVSRACFLCYDPECCTPESPTPLGRSFIDAYATIQPTTDQATTNHIPIIQPTTIQPPLNSPKVEAITDESEIIDLLKVWLNKQLSFVEGSRNKYVSMLCGAFNRYGVREITALATLLQYAEEGFTVNEIQAIVRSIYSVKAFHNTAQFEANKVKEIVLEDKKPDPEPVIVTPLFPIAGFPDFIQTMILECTRVYGTHRDLWAAAFFAASSLSIGQSVMLKTKYENTALFWMAVVGVSGVGKSEPFRIAFKILNEIDYKLFEYHKKEVAQYKIDKKAAKGDESPPAQPLPCKQSIIIDSTPEAMAKSMSANPRGIGILRDELHGWFKDFGRYAASGEQQNMLSTWSQQTFKVNRAGSEALFIQDPYVGVYGGIQPGVLPELAKDNRAINGFLQRFIFVYPDKIEVPRYTNEELSEDLKIYYRTYTERLLSLTGYREEIRLNSEALELYADFFNKNSDLNNSGKQTDYMNEVNAKLDIVVLRIAIVFHFSQWACTGSSPAEITAQTMKSAIQLTEYFRITAAKVYEIISQKSTDKKDVARYLATLGNSQTDIATVLKVSQQYISKILI